MRRPLFTTGIPQALPAIADILATPNSALSILDLRDLSTELQSYTRFLTLYAGNQQNASGDIVQVAWREGAGTPVLLVEQTLATGLIFEGPVKLLDRFPLRGDVEVIASTAVGDAAVVWGYFELDTVESSGDNIRPLQPGPLVSPFSYAPVHVVEGDADETIHLLNTDYYDLVTLDAVSSGAEANERIIVNDGADSISLKVGTVDAIVRLFDGIPMMGAEGTPLITAHVAGGGTYVTAWGYFTRVS